MDKNEFDIDFDFEKEYGFDPDMLLDTEDGFNDADFDEFRDAEESAPAVPEEDEDEDEFEEFDLDEAFSELDLDGEEFDINVEDLDFDAEDFGLGKKSYPREEPEADEDDDLDFELTEEDLLAGEPEFLRPRDPEVFAVPAEPAFAVDEVPEEFQMPEEFQLPEEPTEPEDASAEEAGLPAPEAPVQPERRRSDAPQNPRRKKRSQMRVFKEAYLPAIIAGVALILMLTFIIGSIVNAVKRNKAETDASISASESVENEQQRIENEARNLMAEAARLAAGYDYEAAADLLDTFSGDMSKYQDMITAKSSYVQMQSQLVEHRDPAVIPNLSFHVLIADPARAFTNKEYGGLYNRNFVTTDEFEKILQQLYENNYVLVDFDSLLQENQDTFFTNTIYLPEGKKPIMITETMVNYFGYMIDSDDDDVPDAGGAGFASRLVVAEDGSIQAEMVDASGNTVTGAYDLVPILENFIQAHPDFSYRGARATLAVTGHEGVFGYRINSEVQSTKGQDYYDEQVAGAQTVAQALRDKGYTIASYTYSNKDYYKYTAAQVATEMTNWTNQITPVLGEVNIMVFALESDIKEYSGTKFNALYDAGFRIFVGKGTTPWAEVNSTYVHQNRLMVTGNTMAWSSTNFSNFFDSKALLNSLRGDVPN